MKLRLDIFAIVLLIAAGSACRSLGGPRDVPGPSTDSDGDPALVDEGDAAKDQTEEEAGPVPADSENFIVDESPDKRGRKVRTSFSGYELIREIKEDEFGIKTTIITIRGNATIRHEKVLITASKMTVVDGVRGELVGNVRIYDRESGLRVYAARADYDRDEQLVNLSGSPHLTVQQEGQKPTLVTCTKIVRDLAAKTATLDGDVRIHHDSWTVIGDAAVYYDQENRVVVKDNPLLFGERQFLSGDQITYNVKERTAFLEGRTTYISGGDGDDNVFGDVATGPPPGLEEYTRKGGNIDRPAPSENDGEDGEVKDAGPFYLTADQIQHSFPRGEEPTTEVRGNVLMTRGESLVIETPYLVALGRDFHTIHTEEGVQMTDRERGMYVEAGVMDYQSNEEMLRLEGNPFIDFLKKDGTVEATLSGAVIERDFADGSTSAWGDVRIERERYTATGEMATFYEDADVIVLEGEPGLEDGPSKIRAEKILFYPEKNRVLLYNRIRGYLGTEG